VAVSFFAGDGKEEGARLYAPGIVRQSCNLDCRMRSKSQALYSLKEVAQFHFSLAL
jgi:hypothetical protein